MKTPAEIMAMSPSDYQTYAKGCDEKNLCIVCGNQRAGDPALCSVCLATDAKHIADVLMAHLLALHMPIDELRDFIRSKQRGVSF